MPDLDQGGVFRETTRIYQGPSLGWSQQVAAPPVSAITVTTPGTTTLQQGISAVHVNVNAAVTIQLYAAKGNAAGAGQVPGSFVQVTLTVNDIGGFAQAFPITIQPAAGETIGGAGFVTIAANYGLFVLLSDVQNGGWTVASGTSGTALTDAPNDGSAYGRQSAVWAKVLPLAGGTITGNLTVSGTTTLGVTALGATTVPTVATGDNSTSAASTAFVKAQAYAPLASPALTGTPTAPTAAIATNSTQLATTAFVKALSSPITASLGADVALNNVSNYFDGPSVAQGTAGTWFVVGTVTVQDTAGAAVYSAKLWDGTTVIASSTLSLPTANYTGTIALSGFLASPAGNLRISVRDANSTSGKILFNFTTNSKDSTITAFRIA